MNNEKMVTRCPQCGTSFRITPAQLQSARGAVRCGACLHIFKARDHLVGTPAAPNPGSALVRKPARSSSAAPMRSAATESAPKPSVPKSSTPISSTPKSSSTPRPSAKGAGAGDTRRAPPQRRQPKPAVTPVDNAHLRSNQTKIDSASGETEDEDFLISDDMGQSKTAEKDPFGISRQSQGDTHSLFERAPRRNEEDSDGPDDADESWAMSLLEDEEEESSSAATVSRADDAQKALDEDDLEDRSPSFEISDAPTDAQMAEASGEEHMRFKLDGEHELEPQSYESERMRAHDPERSALLMNIDPEPVEMNWARQRHRSPQRKWLWSALAAFALFVLAIQIAWLQFDRLSRVEPYRSAYGLVCPLVGCDLPALVDRSRIRAYNLVVRNHPDRTEALIVDAILLNTARFSQPFPELVLEFSDLNGAALAARAFLPEEYLSGELAGRATMPPNQPIHLTLELVDPGEEAVNYRAYIPD